MGELRREEDDVIPLGGILGRSRRRAQDALAPVAVDGVPQALGRHKGEPAITATVRLPHGKAHGWVIHALATLEDPLKLLLGLDGLHGRRPSRRRR